MRQFVLAFTLIGLLGFIGCGSSQPSSNDEESAPDAGCTEPHNPYTEGTGHYAGFEWAENNSSGTCNTSSESFNEGCEEYDSQESEYQDCEARKKH
jgi:hypothetical protein